MHSLTRFLRMLRSSLFDISSYGKRGETFWIASRYLWSLCFIASLIIALKSAVLLSFFVPNIDGFLVAARQGLDEAYPKELVVTVESGSLHTNVSSPYFIEFPPSLVAYFSMEQEQLPHFVVIDTGGTVEDFPSYRTIFLFTEKSFAMIDRERNARTTSPPLQYENYRVRQYSASSELLEVNAELYGQLQDKVESYFVYLRPVVVTFIVFSVLLLPFVSAVFWVLAVYIYLLPATLVLWLLSLCIRRKLAFDRLFVLSLYGVSASVLYAALERLFGFHIPYVQSILFFAYMIPFLVQTPKKSS